MAGLVLDASVALAWAFAGEVRSEEARGLIGRVAREGAVVPPLWRLEVGNALLVGERRGRLLAARVDEAMAILAALPLSLDGAADARAWSGSRGLARAHGLSLYDASYLEAAQRLGLPLASFDAALRRAAAAEGVPLAEAG